MPQTLILTTLALFAFAANSLLCRMALGAGLIDPVSFTTLRLVSGALALWPLARMFDAGTASTTWGSWRSGVALFVYAIGFSLAYLTLSTGMGALLLFGAVQLTMLVAALRGGERFSGRQWAGFSTALGGLVYLLLPGLEAPNAVGALLMISAGLAWGLYSLWGRGVTAPIAMTAGNFARAAPLALAGSLLFLSSAAWTPAGVALALVSGVLTSGIGYVIWYRALPRLSTGQASVVQLLVPVLAALAGTVVLAEPLTLRLLLAGALILGGVLLAAYRPSAGNAAGRQGR